MQRLLDDLFTAHSINVEAEPTPDAVEALQRLLDGVPERWRDADLALVARLRDRDVVRA